jgi:hypothetical protein
MGSDDSGHWYDEDVYWDEESATRDQGWSASVSIRNTKHMGCTEPRRLRADREFDETYQSSKGKGGKAKGKG